MAKTSVSTVERNKAQAVVKTMNAALQKINAEVSGILSTMGTQDIFGRHKLGTRINKVSADEKAYGSNAAGKISTAQGISTTEFYKCRTVAQCWTVAQLKDLTKRTVTGSKKTITFSHLAYLASPTVTKGLRTELLKRFFKEGLSVRDLEAASQQLLGRRGNNPTGGRGRIKPRSPKASLTSYHKLGSNLLRAQKDLDNTLFDPVAEKPGEYADKDFLKSLVEGKAEQEKIAETAETNVRKLTASIDAVKRALSSAGTKRKASKARPTAKKKVVKKKVAASNGNGKKKVKKKVVRKRTPADVVAAARGGKKTRKVKKKVRRKKVTA